MTDYRYTLTRDLSDTLTAAGRHNRLCWVMLNPSTADDERDDHTIRCVTRITRDAGYGQLEVVNLFAARSTNPKRLFQHDDPVGPGNLNAIVTAFGRATTVVFAWGASGGWRALEHGRAVHGLAVAFAHRPFCLGVTADGSPRHPSRVPAHQTLVPFVGVIAA